MAHFHTMSVSVEGSVNLLCDLKTSFHYTDTGEAKQGNLLYHKSHFVIVASEMNTQAEKSVHGCFMNALLSASLFFSSLCREKKRPCVPLIIYLSSLHHIDLHHSYNNGNFQMTLPSPPPSLHLPLVTGAAVCAHPATLFITLFVFLTASHTHK